MLPKVVLPADLLLHNRVLVDADRVAELARALPLDLHDALRSDIDPRMVRFEVEKLLLVRHLLQPGELPLLVVDLVLHELLNGAYVVLDDMLVRVDMRQIVDLFCLKSLLFFCSSLLLLPSLLCQAVEPLGDVTAVYL